MFTAILYTIWFAIKCLALLGIIIYIIVNIALTPKYFRALKIVICTICFFIGYFYF